MRFTSVKMLFLSMMLSFSANLFAVVVDDSTVKTVATNFMKKKTGKNVVISEIITEKYEGKTSVYGINFEGGGWVIVSSRDEMWPILGFNTTGKYESTTNSENETFKEILGIYGKTITSLDSTIKNPSQSSSSSGSSSESSESNDIKNKWNSLMSYEGSLRSYTPGEVLLRDERGENIWSQENGSDGISIYNNDCPIDTESEEQCRTIVGCPAMGLSQVMWKWRWPEFAEISQAAFLRSLNPVQTNYSIRKNLTRGVVSYDGFDWNLIPNELNQNTPSNEVKETTHLLRQAGESLHLSYGCDETSILVVEIFDLYHHALGEFGYNLYSCIWSTYNGNNIENWSDYDWNNMIRTEIDAERPVIYNCNGYQTSYVNGHEVRKGVGHIYVISGYYFDDTNYFYCNLGWGGIADGYYQILRTNENFDALSGYNHCAVVGISPKYPTESGDVTLDFDVVKKDQTRGKNAMENIVAPSAEKSGLEVEEGGKLLLRAGKNIKLKPGFAVKKGAKFNAKIVPEFAKDHSITVWLKDNSVGYNGNLSFDVTNANSWLLTITDASGQIFTRTSGLIESDGVVSVWSGDRFVTENYSFEITFMNNFGSQISYVGKFESRVIELLKEPTKSNWINTKRSNETWCVFASANGSNNESSSANNGSDIVTDVFQNESSNNEINVYPNPTSGILKVVANSNINEVVVLDMIGNEMMIESANSNKVSLDLSSLAKGMYLVKVVTDEDSKVVKVARK